jgi:hypothetical protein
MTKASETLARREMRPPMRSEDPRALAAKRAAEIRGNGSDLEDGTDEFATPTPPDGWTYEWKRRYTMNQEDLSHMNHVRRTGWTPVPVERHPEMMQVGAEGSIERKGMMLMERPEEITQDFRDRERRAARQQVQIKEGQMDPKGRGGLTDRNDSRVAPKIKKGFDFAIPEE